MAQCGTFHFLTHRLVLKNSYVLHWKLSDLLWADPMEDFNDDSAELFKFNDNRGCSFLFR